jgi:hypothetical protein
MCICRPCTALPELRAFFFSSRAVNNVGITAKIPEFLLLLLLWSNPIGEASFKLLKGNCYWFNPLRDVGLGRERVFVQDRKTYLDTDWRNHTDENLNLTSCLQPRNKNTLPTWNLELSKIYWHYRYSPEHRNPKRELYKFFQSGPFASSST